MRHSTATLQVSALHGEGIADAATRPTMRIVTLKSEDQLDIQTLHRSRDRLVGKRPALNNLLRAVLFERGIVIPKGRTKLNQRLREEVPAASGLSLRKKRLVEEMTLELQALYARILEFDREFAELSRTDETMRALLSIPGVGVINATAIGAAKVTVPPLPKGVIFSLARTGPPSSHDKREASARLDYEAREQLLAHSADPLLPFGPARSGEDRDAAGELAAGAARTSEAQCGRRGAGQ